jgi:hypothetical protein
MNPRWLCLWFAPGLLLAQTPNKPLPLTEDRVHIIVNDQAQIIEKRLAELNDKQLALYKQDFDQRAKAVEQELAALYKIGGVIAALLGVSVLAVLGWATKYARNYAQKRIEQEVDLAIYKLDPRRWPIRIPRQNFDVERKRLDDLKYRNLIAYDGLNASCKEGITVYFATSDDDLKRLKQFMTDEQIDPLKCCFVIYYTGAARLNTQLLAPFDNFVLSNMPGTLSSQIFAASRNIIHGE